MIEEAGLERYQGRYVTQSRLLAPAQYYHASHCSRVGVLV